MTNVLILLTLPEDVRVQYRDRLKAKFPELNVDLVDHHSKVDPFAGQADVLITFGPMLVDRVFALSKRLKWVQALGTGVDNLIDLPSLPKDAIVTNLHGIHGPPLSEAAFAAMLLLSRRMHQSIRAQDKRQWARWPSALLNGKTVGVLGVARFMMPNVLVEPPTKFKIGPPNDYAPGTVSTKWQAQFNIWVVNGEVDGVRSIYALSTVCTHLGCTPNWLEGEQKFKCPCHGSGFYKSGVNFEGPAPRPLERFGIRLAEDGMLEVDKSVKFQKELGQWTNPACFVGVT